MFARLLKPVFIAISFIAVFAGPARVDAQVFDLAPVDGPAVISDGVLDTNKIKVLRMPDGALVAVFGQEQAVGQQVYDLKARATRNPWDLVVQYSIDDGDTWSTPINVDNTAAQTSAPGIIEATGAPPLFPAGHPDEGYVDLASDPRVVPYPGDSDKPQAFNAGNNIVVTFNSTYCPADPVLFAGEEQRFAVYLSLNGITIPYSCLYVTRMQWNSATQSLRPIGPGGLPYITERVTSGIRSVKQDVPINQTPGFVAVWQEDPLGLQLGNADGPGDGASGANTTGGTDIWYMYLDTNNNSTADFVGNSWSVPVRLTQNQQQVGELQGPDRTSHGPGIYEDGKAAASRANVRLIGRRVLVAWEERKSTTGIDDGKYVRYHSFPEFTDVSGLPINGCIISKPDENGRRVRILTQPLSAGQTGVVFIYKLGDFAQGGPSDIMLRRAIGGYDPVHIVPPVDSEITGAFGERCRAHVNNQDDDTVGDDELMDDPLNDIRFGTLHLPAVNFSGTENYLDLPGTAPNAGTGVNPFEDALAHRGLLKGNLVIVGYSHVPDQARFQFLNDSIPYNFYIRSSEDGGTTWSEAVNVSNLTPQSGVSVREPRIVGTAGNGPGCADPQNPVDPTDCSNPDIFYFGFGTQTNVNNFEQPVDVDIFMGVSQDGGQSYSAIQAVTAGDVLNNNPDDEEDLETQMKIRPDGLQAFVFWTGTPPGGPDNADFRRLSINPDLIFRDGFESP
ncbi:MAG: hypothetical protein CVV18_04480 [Gammaproteobacteria bacterium HGW-Gammaproteobacteria-8]|nr:MAG: hypothetical protein CVV18_04480 [Gammaproteobacteria bacterium HGW-Gammaproteobacteria-8]